MQQFQEFKDFNERLRLLHPKHTFRMHPIDRPGTVIPVGHHLNVNTQYNCLVESISCGGAQLNMSRFIELPKNFFLVILGSTEKIGATEYRREGDVLVAKFNMFLDPTFLQSVVGTASLEGDVV